MELQIKKIEAEVNLSINSIKKALEKLNSLEQQLPKKIQNEKEEKNICLILAETSEIVKNIDTIRKKYSQPVYNLYKKINSLFKPYLEKAKSFDEKIRDLLIEYKQNEKKQKKVSIQKYEFDNFIIHYRIDYDIEIEDETKIPRQYLSPDMKKIQEAVKMGIRKIKGVKITPRLVPVVRMKK